MPFTPLNAEAVRIFCKAYFTEHPSYISFVFTKSEDPRTLMTMANVLFEGEPKLVLLNARFEANDEVMHCRVIADDCPGEETMPSAWAVCCLIGKTICYLPFYHDREERERLDQLISQLAPGSFSWAEYRHLLEHANRTLVVLARSFDESGRERVELYHHQLIDADTAAAMLHRVGTKTT